MFHETSHTFSSWTSSEGPEYEYSGSEEEEDEVAEEEGEPRYKMSCARARSDTHTHTPGSSHPLAVSPRLPSPTSSIVNVPGEWTLRREFLRLQTQDGDEGGPGGGGAQQRQQVGFDPCLVWRDPSNRCTPTSLFALAAVSRKCGDSGGGTKFLDTSFKCCTENLSLLVQVRFLSSLVLVLIH